MYSCQISAHIPSNIHFQVCVIALLILLPSILHSILQIGRVFFTVRSNLITLLIFTHFSPAFAAFHSLPAALAPNVKNIPTSHTVPHTSHPILANPSPILPREKFRTISLPS